MEKKLIMTFIVVTNVVASRPTERRLTGTPHARANKKSECGKAQVGVSLFVWHQGSRFYLGRSAGQPVCQPVCQKLPCIEVVHLKMRVTISFWNIGNPGEGGLEFQKCFHLKVKGLREGFKKKKIVENCTKQGGGGRRTWLSTKKKKLKIFGLKHQMLP